MENGMPVYLNELEVGTATDVIGFPHLLVCMGIVAMTNASLYGLHIDSTIQAQQDIAYAQFDAFITGRGAGPILALYGSCNHNVRYNGAPNMVAAWQAEMSRVAAALGGWHGPVHGFDTSIIAPNDGTYVEYVADFAGGSCAIFYKRNEKMGYQNTNHNPTVGFNPDIRKISLYKGALVNVMSETTSADIVRTWSNKGRLHEVNYATRLLSFNA